MGAIKVLFSVGGGLIGSGVFLHLFKDIISEYISPYVFNPSDPYYRMSNLEWGMIPFVIIICGAACLAFGAKLWSGEQEG